MINLSDIWYKKIDFSLFKDEPNRDKLLVVVGTLVNLGVLIRNEGILRLDDDELKEKCRQILFSDTQCWLFDKMSELLIDGNEYVEILQIGLNYVNSVCFDSFDVVVGIFIVNFMLAMTEGLNPRIIYEIYLSMLGLTVEVPSYDEIISNYKIK